MGTRENHLVFTIDDQQFGLPMSTVERIIRAVEIRPVPEAPDYINGVINMQGRVIPVVNLRKRFRLPEREMGLTDQLMITKAGDRTFALVIDAVVEIIDLGAEQFCSASQVMPNLEEYVDRVVNRENGMVLISHPEKILPAKEETGKSHGMNDNGNAYSQNTA